VLLTQPDALPQATADELTRLKPATITVVGGPTAVSDAVVAQLRNYTSGPVSRRAGNDRAETAAAMSAAVFQPGVPVVYVANGGGFADALAGAPAAGHGGGPILLVSRDAIPSATSAELSRLGPANIVILGGPAVVSSNVEQQLHAFSSTVGRSAGADRYTTSVAVATNAFSPGVPTLFLATGENYPDALAGGPAGGLAPGPILLVHHDCITPEVNAEIDQLRPGRIVVLGGTNAVGTAVENRTTCAPPPPPPPPTTTTTTPPGGSNCSPNYPDFCIPPPPPDLNCSDLNPQQYPGAKPNFRVVGGDPHNFDSDHDGFGCETSIG
jgi:putative cell wall-binding protein